MSRPVASPVASSHHQVIKFDSINEMASWAEVAEWLGDRRSECASTWRRASSSRREFFHKSACQSPSAHPALARAMDEGAPAGEV